MKLEQLCEGLIQIPKGLKKNILDFYLSMLLSKYRDMMPRNVFNRIHDAVKQNHSIHLQQLSDTEDFQQTFRYSQLNLPKHYRSQDGRAKQLIAIASFTGTLMDPEADAEFGSGRHANEILVNLPPYLSDTVLAKLSDNPSIINQLIHKLNGAIDHELTHMVQSDFLKHKDKSMDFDGKTDYRKDDGKIDYGKYSDISYEQDPLLKTSIHDFKAIVDGYRHITGKPMDSNRVKYVFSYFTDPSNDGSKMRVALPNGSPAKLSDANITVPLRLWKNKNPKLWKRAVKYFYNEIRDLI